MRERIKNLWGDLQESCDMRQAMGMSCLFAYILLFCLSTTFVPVVYVSAPVPHSVLLLAFLIVLLLTRYAASIAVVKGEDGASSHAQPPVLPYASARSRIFFVILPGVLLSTGSLCLWLPEHPFALSIAAILVTIGAVAQLLCWGEAAALVRLRRRVVSCGFAGIAAPLFYLVLVALPLPLAAPLAALLPVASAVLGARYWRNVENVPGRRLALREVAQTQSKAPLDVRLSITVFSYGCLFTLIGYGLLQPGFSNAPDTLPGKLCVFLFLLAQIAMAIYMVKIIHKESPKAAYRPIPVLLAVGFLLLSFASDTVVLLCMALAFAGFGCFAIYYWIILGNVAQRLRSTGVAVYSFGLVLLVAGALAGELLMLFIEQLGALDIVRTQAIAAVGFFILVLALWQMSDGSVFANETREMGGSFSLEPEVLLTNNVESAERLALTFGLSTREREVLQLLLSGRNVPAICDELFISKHTVQTHVKHIYTKTGVSKRQQLLTLAEELRV